MEGLREATHSTYIDLVIPNLESPQDPGPTIGLWSSSFELRSVESYKNTAKLYLSLLKLLWNFILFST